MVMKKKELLNEIMGVPKQLDPWIDAITNILLRDINQRLVSGGWDHTGSLTYKDPNDGQEYKISAHKMEDKSLDEDEIRGLLMKEFGFTSPQEFIKSDIFKVLPIWNLTISYSALGYESKFFEGDLVHDFISGGISMEPTSKFGQILQTKVIPKAHLRFDVVLNSEGITDKTEEELKATIAHELLHAHQSIKQLEGGKDTGYGKEQVLNILAGAEFFKELRIEWWDYFLNLVYLHLSFEVNARMNQLYHTLKKKDIRNSEDLVRELKKTGLWSQMESLEKFDAKEFISEFKMPDVENVFNGNSLEMLYKLEHKLRMKNLGFSSLKGPEENIKVLIKIWDGILQLGVQAMKEKGVNIEMEDVPQKAKENPYIFFKFFEKRFHKKAKIWKRKMYKVGSLILNEKGEGTLQTDR
jgi:hypothetical protein